MPKEYVSSKGREEPLSGAAAKLSHDRALPERIHSYEESRQPAPQSLDPLMPPQGEDKPTASPPITSSSLVRYKGPQIENYSQDTSQKDPQTRLQEFLQRNRYDPSTDLQPLENQSSFIPHPQSTGSHKAQSRQDGPRSVRNNDFVSRMPQHPGSTASPRTQYNGLELDSIKEFLEKHQRASSRDRRPLVNGSTFDPHPPPTSRPDRSRAAVMVAPLRKPVATPRRRAATATWSSTNQSSVFDHSQNPESYYSASSAPSLGPDPSDEVSGLLPCEFFRYTRCDFRYDLDDPERWISHIINDHLGNRLPTICACWYCDDYIFDPKISGLDEITNFRQRLYHIREHIIYNGGTSRIRPDHNFAIHLLSLGIISQSTYDADLTHGGFRRSYGSGIYSPDFVPPEHQHQIDRSASLVVNESPREEKRKRRPERRRPDIKDHRHSLTLGKIEEQPVTSPSDPVSSTRTENAELNTSYRTTQRTSDSHITSPSSTHSIEKKPSMVYKDDAPFDAYTPKQQKVVVAESSKPRLGALKSEQLSPHGSVDSLSDLLSHHQEQSKLNRTPQREDKRKLYFTSDTRKEQSPTSRPDPSSLATNEESEMHCFHQTMEMTTESYPSSPRSPISIGEIPDMLGEDDICHDANTLTQQREVLSVDSQPKLEDLNYMRWPTSERTELLQSHEQQPASDRSPLIQPSQTSEAGNITTSESTTRHQAGTALCSPSFPSQLDLVGVGMERLSIFDHCLADSGSGDGLDNEADVPGYEHGVDVTEGESNHTDNQGRSESSSTSSSTGSTPSLKRLNRDAINRAREEGSDEDQDERGNGLDQKRKKRVCTKKPMRFACPYQAYDAIEDCRDDAFQDCLKPGPRNPHGGCEGINRLKQHLNRRHKESFRCKRCWGTFDSPHKANEHETQAIQCSSREKLPNEKFMTRDQEAKIEDACRSVPAEEAWWNLFRLLIPGMRGRDIVSLRPRYQPYYVRRMSRSVFPSRRSSNTALESVSQSAPTIQGAMYNIPDVSNPGVSNDDDFGSCSLLFEPQPESSQTMGIPFPLESNTTAGHGDVSTSFNTTGMSSSDQLNTSFDPLFSSGNLAPPPIPAPAYEIPGSMEPCLDNQSRLRTINAQLSDQILRSEEGNNRLRRTIQETREDLTHAGTLVRDLMRLEDSSNDMFKGLLDLSDFLGSAKERLT